MPLYVRQMGLQACIVDNKKKLLQRKLVRRQHFFRV